MNPLNFRWLCSLLGIAVAVSLSAAETPVEVAPEALVSEALEANAGR
jgi:hypothetical protein